MATAGDNSDKLLKSYTSRLTELLARAQEIKEEIKEELKAAKGAGLDMKALYKVARELALDSGQMEKQLSFEFALHDYRRAVGLPTSPSESAQEAA